MTKPAFFAFAGKELMRPGMKPFTIGLAANFVLFAAITAGGSKWHYLSLIMLYSLCDEVPNRELVDFRVPLYLSIITRSRHPLPVCHLVCPGSLSCGESLTPQQYLLCPILMDPSIPPSLFRCSALLPLSYCFTDCFAADGKEASKGLNPHFHKDGGHAHH